MEGKFSLNAVQYSELESVSASDGKGYSNDKSFLAVAFQ
jgi:hypothetical protein